MPRLFVYGTLRVGGYYHHLIKDAPLIKSAISLSGYELRLASGLYYPYAFRADQGILVGDLFEVTVDMLEGPLDALEDTASGYYERYFDVHQGFYIYLKIDADKSQYTLIADGDWIRHWEASQR